MSAEDESVIGRIDDLSTPELVQLLEEDPIVACEAESRGSCIYKQEYGWHLSDYAIERLKRWPDCEACGTPLVVIRDPE